MRKLILYTPVICFILVVSALLASCNEATAPTNTSPQLSPTTIPSPESKTVEVNGTRNLLFIPPILEDEDPSPTSSSLTLIAQESTKEFLQGKNTKTYGYNGDYLGPTIRVKKGPHNFMPKGQA